MERALETIKINNALEIVRLKGNLKFKHPLGYGAFLFTAYSVILCFLQALQPPGLSAVCSQCMM